MRIAVTGATGRMGSSVIETVEESLEHELAFAVDREEQQVNNLQVHHHDNFLELLESEQPDMVIDFTMPDGTMKYAEECSEAGVPLVTGTTGFTEEQFEQLENYGEQIPLLRASNFSQGVNVLRQLVRQAVDKLPNYEIEVVEAHHSRKTDAPSGTAKTIVEDIEDERELEDNRVHGREGEQPRQENEIGMHAIRAGSIKGSHEVIMAGNDETLRIRHESGSRQVFVEGAITAAKWLDEQEPGYYSFEEVIN